MQATRAFDGPGPAVFLRESVDIRCPVQKVEGRLCGDGHGDRLVRLARRATDHGDRLVHLGPLSAGGRVGLPVQVRLGEPVRHPTFVAVPIRWEAAALTGLFPVLDGDLELSAPCPGTCRLSLTASYRPPLHAVGDWLDRTLLHRVAESTTRSFLRFLAAELGTPARP